MCCSFRLVIVFLTTAAITLVYALRLAFHSTVLCQVPPNDTDHYLADPTLRGYQYASVSVGLFIGLIPLFFLSERVRSLGTKNVLSIYGAIGCVSSFLYPLSDYYGFLPSLIIRTVQGIPGAILLLAVTNVSREWAPKSDAAFSIGILTCLYQAAPFVAMAVSGQMCAYGIWEWTYYSLGALTSIVFILFFVLYKDSPYESRFVSEKEADLIMEGKTKNNAPIPYAAVLRDGQVWLIWYVYFAFFMGTYVFLQYGPTYINKVLDFNVAHTGWLSAAPHLVSMFLKFFYGMLLDKCRSVSAKWGLILCYAIVQTLSAACLATVVFTTSPWVALIVYCVFNTLHGLVIVAVMRQILVISGHHSDFLSNVNTLIVVLCIFTTPWLVNVVVPDNSPEQWSRLFAGIAVLLMSAVVLFTRYATSSPRKWTEIEVISQEDVEMA